MKYGRSDDEWNELVDAATDYLVEIAKDRTLTNYTDLSAELVRRTGYPGFDFNMDRDQAAVGALLGEVTDGTYDEIGAMLSSLDGDILRGVQTESVSKCYKLIAIRALLHDGEFRTGGGVATNAETSRTCATENR